MPVKPMLIRVSIYPKLKWHMVLQAKRYSQFLMPTLAKNDYNTMKIGILASLLLIMFLNSYSQVKVNICGVNEIVYTLTPNETNNINELISLQKFFKEKKVVGMGEATHGTKEFFNMKAKMFKFLVLNCGYKIFSIEATFGGALKVNRYVLFGEGDILSAMH